MSKKILAAAATAVALVATAAAVSAQDGGRRFNTNLTGAAEKPGPGDADGTGTAEVRINPGQGQVCYEINVQNIEPATLAHIHDATPNDPGPVVVTFEPPSDGSSSGCIDVSRELALNIIQSPTEYYVNVHTATFPAGAVRGNLSGGSNPPLKE